MGKNEKTTTDVFAKNGFYVIAPVNLACFLDVDEEKVLLTIKHIQDMNNNNPISLSFLIGNTCMSKARIIKAKANLIKMNLISTNYSTNRGDVIIINYSKLIELLEDLNNTYEYITRLKKGDEIRTKSGLDRKNYSLINVLTKLQKSKQLTLEERGKELVTAKPTSTNKGQKQHRDEAIKLCNQLNEKKKQRDANFITKKEYESFIVAHDATITNNNIINKNNKWEIE